MPSNNGVAWTPRVLSEYEIGRAVGAIEAVSRSDKPIAEVGSIDAARTELEADLQGCLGLVRGADDIRFWIRPGGDSWRFGYYREAWAVNALDFLDSSDLSEFDRAWISGLLFGYRPTAIQDFISRQTLHCEQPRAIAG
jgi:hypothetical protein